MIHIIDYGLGNIHAFVTTYKRLGIEAVLARTVDDLTNVSKLILPGVGAFDHAMELFNASGMKNEVERLVLQEKIPVLGICVGMQILGEISEEGVSSGLGWIKGAVRSFSSTPESESLPMPHMGWNDVVPAASSPLFYGLEKDARFYFLHSYYFDCANQSDVAAKTDYGFQFDCAVQHDNIFGVQFHPEKSHHWGSALLKNFAEL
jgi:glutamine amidotransferase